jgi:hypothetical protein
MITIRLVWWKIVLVILILANLLLADKLLRMEPVEPERWMIPIYYSNWKQV